MRDRAGDLNCVGAWRGVLVAPPVRAGEAVRGPIAPINRGIDCALQRQVDDLTVPLRGELEHHRVGIHRRLGSRCSDQRAREQAQRDQGASEKTGVPEPSLHAIRPC